MAYQDIFRQEYKYVARSTYRRTIPSDDEAYRHSSSYCWMVGAIHDCPKLELVCDYSVSWKM